MDEKTRDVVSGLKHNNRLKCHRGIVSQWMSQVGLNVMVDETWVDVTSRHCTMYRSTVGTLLNEVNHKLDKVMDKASTTRQYLLISVVMF